jgi:isopentenyl diphosphate isomerase/L-lactate dehydrogenase-like FMN-dependent dehydrogenase
MPVFDATAVGRNVYAAGLAGRRPELAMTCDGWEARASEVMSAEAYAYVAGGAGAEHTVRANLAAFAKWRIVPRMLRDVSVRDTSVRVAGTLFPFPVLTAPVGVMTLAHPDGELAVARATAELGLGSVVSTASSYSLEEIAAAAPGGTRWYQLYWPRDHALAESFVRRAEAAGYAAIVVTLDTFTIGWRPRDLQLAHLPFLRATGIANYLSDPVFRSKLRRAPEESQEALGEAVLLWGAIFGNPALTWDDLRRLRAWTKLPIVLKGICHPDDARAALDAGVDGIIVSNHGGRQIDRALPALDALPAVAAVARGKTSVLFDSGIRSGADVLVALALGAEAVLVGRPFVYGLALAGQAGVDHVLRCLLAEFETSLMLSGHASARLVDMGGIAPQTPGADSRA